MTRLQVLGPNFWRGELPVGCMLCREGAKMVLYITGHCQSHCFYCPVAKERMYVDRTFANERELPPGDVTGLLEEARAMNAKGAGITGGDPMTNPDRVIVYCTALKREFGADFHTHLYTQNVFDPAWLLKLKAGGLDEIRFHPPVGWWTKMADSPWNALLPAALRAGLRTGLEVPAIPYKEEALWSLVVWAESAGAEFLNLNELEFSEANIDHLSSRGFELLNDASNVVKDSSATARNLVERSLKARTRMTVHFCASTYKDSVQLRKRLLRRAENTQRGFEAPTPDGTFLFGVIEGVADLDACYDRLVEEHAVPPDQLQVNRAEDRIEIAPWILEEIHGTLPAGSCAIVEVHATSKRLEVERTPLPYPEGDWESD